MKDNMKESIKAKGAAVKAKLKGMKDKAKGAKQCAAVLAFALCGALLTGCMDTNPASRQNSNAFGDIEPTVKVVLGPPPTAQAPPRRRRRRRRRPPMLSRTSTSTTTTRCRRVRASRRAARLLSRA